MSRMCKTCGLILGDDEKHNCHQRFGYGHFDQPMTFQALVEEIQKLGKVDEAIEILTSKSKEMDGAA
jgi:hypothetical protein